METLVKTHQLKTEKKKLEAKLNKYTYVKRN